MPAVYIERDLKQVANRFWWWSVWRNLTWVWLGALVIAWLTVAWSWANERPWPAVPLLAVTIATAAVVFVASWWQRFDLRWVAQRIELAHPELETKLLAAYEQERTIGDRGFLQMAVIEQAATHSLAHERWQETVPTRRLWAWSGAHWMFFLLVLGTFGIHTRWSPVLSGAGITLPENLTEAVLKQLHIEVEPGNIELERGADLLVMARFPDADRLPREVTLHTKAGSREENFKLQQSLSDPLFAVRVPEVKQDLVYRLRFESGATEEYRVTVFDYPELERADAELTPPSYTQQPTRRVEDVRQFSVIEGTKVQLLCRLNKPVATARLVPADGEAVPMTVVDSKDPLLVGTSRVLTEGVRWKLELTDDKGRHNRQSVEFVIDVVRNQPPQLKLVFPKRDLKVSPLQEVALESEVADDFGVLRWGLEYEMTGRKKESVVFGENLAPNQKQTGQRLIALEDLQAKADELLAWHVWAEDLGPDGKVRRTTSDIFFAEVSPFEEIFREGQSPSGEGQPMDKKNQNPVNETAAKQKEIVTAIWNLRRREQENATPSPKYAEDAQVIADGQQKLIESLEELKEKLESPDAAATVAEIEQHMQRALQQLTAAATTNRVPPLDEALPAAQAAYQALLRLRARENRVMKSKSSKSSSSSSSSQQSAAGQELDQLEMNKDEQRYETKKNAADAKQTPAQKEKEEIANRLRELARRQEDTNQKVKELQAALDAAKTEEEKKQLERQLKRLRDEQRDLLRDVDQLKNKVEKPEHNQPLADASRQLQETRENARQASDALEKGQMQQALAAGTRAENALDKLREDFRKQNSNQVAEEVRDLAERARQLDERQQQIGEQLAEGSKNPAGKKPAAGGLRPMNAEAAKPKLADELKEQKKELADVLDKAKELTERVEGNEPLLSKKLYDTVREAHQKQTPRAVEIMQQLTERGLPGEANKLAPQAQQGIKQLREGIEKAAEGVLGNDVEGLRRAKKEVDRLAQALSEEMAAQGMGPKRRPGAEGDSKIKPQAGEGNEPGKEPQPNSAGDPAGQKPGEGKPGEGKPGENSKKGGSAGKNPDGKTPPSGTPGKPMGNGGQPMNEPSPAGDPSAGEQPGDASKSPMGDKQNPKGQPGQSKTGNEKTPENGKSPGQQPGGKPGEQPGDQPGQQPGDQPGQPSGSPKGDSPMPGNTGTKKGNSPQSPTSQPNGQPNSNPQPGESQPNSQTAGAPGGVLTGGNWREWSDALRNVEEFVPGTRLRSDAARVREQAQAIRAEFKRHSKAPNWEAVRETIYEPLVELQRQLNEELLRRSSPEAAVPLDRDPVPDRFGDAVKRYYERLGSGQ